MIEKITGKAALHKALNGIKDVYTECVRSFADAYGTDYDFCTFYKQTGGTLISNYYGSAVVAKSGKRTGDRLAELMEFLTCGMFRKVLMPYESFEAANFDANVEKINLMVYRTDVKISDDMSKVISVSEDSVGEISEIIADGFDIDCNKWYTDMSHMLRHGTAKIYTLDGKACAVRMYASSGIAYLSYICTRRSERGRGLASRLISGVCDMETAAGNEIYIFCRDNLKGFYEKNGFDLFGEAAELTI